MIGYHHIHFLIVESDPFIARDMSEGLMEAAPDCTVQIFASAADLLAADPRHDRPVIITKLTIAAIKAAGLDVAAARMNAIIVVRQGDDPYDQVMVRGWLSLPTPFTCENLLDLVVSLRPIIPAA